MRISSMHLLIAHARLEPVRTPYILDDISTNRYHSIYVLASRIVLQHENKLTALLEVWIEVVSC